ncbi:MAG: VOC family protein [Phototrophicales bacterium]|nr:VOC family protein [Phototrophicales bacterium]
MSNPPIDSQITFIYTQNLAMSINFYENLLKLTLWLDQTTCRIYRLTDSALLGICQVSETSKGNFIAQPTNLIITIVTQQVDEWYATLSSRGVIFDSPPSYNPNYRIYHCFLKDPNGYLIEIQRFDHNLPPAP